jgi:hypothetical protein
MFQVVYHQATRRIDGLEPKGGVGPDHGVAVINDMAEYDNLQKYDPAYLSADGAHIVGAPPA